ncbi:MAG TPA: T9SS type A sorting domain-containing protein [Ferruginibacter sp.]|nr:T9SS type A sorting domain-containing protein [Ferruginibacter sp.]
MKFFTSCIALLLLCITASAQNCVQATAASFSNPSNDGVTWRLTLNWQADGQKYFNVIVRVGTTNPATVLNTCLSINAGGGATGTHVYNNIIAPGGIPTLSASFERFTGSCGGGNSCGITQIIPVGSGVLPIKISSFYARRNGNTVSLNWASETEVNAKQFIIEKNTGSGYVAVGTVDAVNNALGSSYSFNDQNMSKAVSQYRLKLVDIDGAFKYSETRAVKGTAAVSDFTIYPNPSMGATKVTITDISEATTVELIDNSGKILKTTQLANTNSIDITGLQKGIYLVRIKNNKTGDALTKKLTVIN